jgi:hypothetical protein
MRNGPILLFLKFRGSPLVRAMLVVQRRYPEILVPIEDVRVAYPGSRAGVLSFLAVFVSIGAQTGLNCLRDGI